MEKYAKGSGRTGLKRAQTNVENAPKRQQTSKPSKEEAQVGSKQESITSSLLAKTESRFLQNLKSESPPSVYDFKSLFEVIPAYQQVINADVADDTLRLYLPDQYEEKRPENVREDLESSLNTFLTENYPGGIQEAILVSFPILIEIGFSNNILAKKEIEMLKALSQSDPYRTRLSDAVLLFWQMYGDQYDPPILTDKDLVSLEINTSLLIASLRGILDLIFEDSQVETIFDVPMYISLLAGRLHGKSVVDLRKENVGLSKVLSRKLFAKSYSKKVNDVCYAFKSKLTPFLTTPSLNFIKVTLTNLRNESFDNQSRIYSLIVVEMRKYTTPEASSVISKLEKDCAELFAKNDPRWGTQRLVHKQALGDFLDMFLTLYVGIVTAPVHYVGEEETIKAFQGLESIKDIHKAFVEKLHNGSGNNFGKTGFRGFSLAISELLISELEQRHRGYICFYASRSNTLNAVAIDLQEFTKAFVEKTPNLTDQNKESLVPALSDLVEGTCYRPSIAQGKTALEMITEYYVEKYDIQDEDFISDDEVEEMIASIRKENSTIRKLKSDSTSHVVYGRELGQFKIGWVEVSELTEENGNFVENKEWYFSFSKKILGSGNQEPSVLEVRMSKPSVLFTNEERKAAVQKKGYKAAKYHSELLDREALQKDRLRSVNMSLFANLSQFSESTLYMLIANYSQTSAGKVFESVLHQNFSEELTSKSPWFKTASIKGAEEYLKTFEIMQRKYPGTLLRFDIPCSKVDDFAYVSLPEGKLPVTKSVKLKKTGKQITGLEKITNAYFSVDQYIRYLTSPKTFSIPSETYLFDFHQVRLLDLCFSSVAKPQGTLLDIFKFYPQSLEDEFRAKTRALFKGK